MCECSGIEDVLRAAAKAARVPAGLVELVYGRLLRDGDHAGRLTTNILSLALGFRTSMVERTMASLASLGVTCDGVVTEMWRPAAAPRSDLSQKPSAIRMRRKRLRDREVELPASAASAARRPSLPVTGDAGPSLFLSSDLPEQENKQQTPRASEPSGFAELRALWPVGNRMPEAEAEHRRYRQHHSNAAIIDAAKRYLAEKPEWRSPLFLVNWLRTDPCKEAVLPLASEPREVTVAQVKPRIDWSIISAQWITGRIWPSDVGPPPDQPDCRMPEGLLQKCRRAIIDQRERASA